MKKLNVFAICFLIAFIVEIECDYTYLIAWQYFTLYRVKFRFFALGGTNITVQLYSHSDTEVLEYTTFDRFFTRYTEEHYYPDIPVPLLSMTVNSTTDFELMVVLLNVEGREVLAVFYPLEVTKMSNIYVLPVTEVLNSLIVVTEFNNVKVEVTTYNSDHPRTEEESFRHYFLTRHLVTRVDFPTDKDNRWRTSSCRLEANDQIAVYLVAAKQTTSGLMRYPIDTVKPPDAYDTSWKSLDLRLEFNITGTYHILPGLSSTVVKYKKPGLAQMVRELEEGDVLKIEKPTANDVDLQVETTESSPALFISNSGTFIGAFTPALKRVYKMHFMCINYVIDSRYYSHCFQAFPEKKEGFILKMDGVVLSNYTTVDVTNVRTGVLLEANIKFGVMAFGIKSSRLLYYNYGVNPRLVIQDFDRSRLKARSKKFINIYYRFVCPITKYGENCSKSCNCPESHCTHTGACYTRKCKTGTFGPHCEKEDLAVFNTQTFLSPWMDSDSNTCEEINNKTIAVNLKYQLRVSKIHLDLKADSEVDTVDMVQNIYVEHTQTREMVEVEHFTVSPDTILQSVDIALDRVYLTRKIWIRFTNVTICTLSIDGGVNIASSETALFSTTSLNKEQLGCLHDGDRHAACLSISKIDKVDIEFSEKMAIKRLAIYSTVSTGPWILRVMLTDELLGIGSEVNVEGGTDLFNFVHVSILINKIHLELVSGQVTLCEVEMYMDGVATSMTDETDETDGTDGTVLASEEQTKYPYSVSAVTTTTTPQHHERVEFSQEEDAPKGTVDFFVLPLILALYCLVHIATVLFVAREAKRQALEEPMKKEDADVHDDTDAATTQDTAATRANRAGKRRIFLPRIDKALEHEV